jgi:VanZ family protein
MFKHLRWALLWALVILILCLLPGRSLPEWNWVAIFDLDKLVHGFMFFVLAVLLAHAFKRAGSPVRFLLWAVVISAGYGLFTELMQGMPSLGRRTDINDMIANTIGALAASGFANWRMKKGWSIVPFDFLR